MNTTNTWSRDRVTQTTILTLGYIFAACIIVPSLYQQISIMTTPLWWTAALGEVLAIPPAYAYMRFLMQRSYPRPLIGHVTWLLIHWAVLSSFIGIGLRSIGTPSWWIMPAVFIVILFLWWLVWYESNKRPKG